MLVGVVAAQEGTFALAIEVRRHFITFKRKRQNVCYIPVAPSPPLPLPVPHSVCPLWWDRLAPLCPNAIASIAFTFFIQHFSHQTNRSVVYYTKANAFNISLCFTVNLEATLIQTAFGVFVLSRRGWLGLGSVSVSKRMSWCGRSNRSARFHQPAPKWTEMKTCLGEIQWRTQEWHRKRNKRNKKENRIEEYWMKESKKKWIEETAGQNRTADSLNNIRRNRIWIFMFGSRQKN